MIRSYSRPDIQIDSREYKYLDQFIGCNASSSEALFHFFTIIVILNFETVFKMFILVVERIFASCAH